MPLTANITFLGNFWTTQLIPSTLVSCGTLLIYDLLCTFDQEVTYVWSSSQWSLGTVLFLLNRYLPFVDTFLSLKLQFSINSPKTCLRGYTAVSWLIVSGIIISEIILVLRTYALWERRRLILIILCITTAVAFIPAIVITYLELQSLRYIPKDGLGCRLATASPIILIAYILLMFSETTMAVLTAIKAYRHLRQCNAPWVVQIYQHGLLFYFYLLLISIANVLVPILAPRSFSNWLATPQRVLHSTLCNRVLLHIFRQRSASNMTGRSPYGGGSLMFGSFEEETYSVNLTVVNPPSFVYNTG